MPNHDQSFYDLGEEQTNFVPGFPILLIPGWNGAVRSCCQNTPLHPVAEWGRGRFGGAETPANHRLASLESALASVKLEPTENARLLAASIAAL
jgi:hypothetical protein